MAKKIKEFSLLRFSKKVVLFCLIFITVYTIVAIIFQAVTGNVLSDTLTERIFTCLIGELAITGMLKITEYVIDVVKGKNDDENGDTEELNEIAVDNDDGLGIETEEFETVG